MTDDEKYWDSVRKLKSKRPKCTSPEGHTFIVYQGDGIQKCHDCDFEEPLVAKDDCNL